MVESRKIAKKRSEDSDAYANGLYDPLSRMLLKGDEGVQNLGGAAENGDFR